MFTSANSSEISFCGPPWRNTAKWRHTYIQKYTHRDTLLDTQRDSEPDPHIHEHTHTYPDTHEHTHICTHTHRHTHTFHTSKSHTSEGTLYAMRRITRFFYKQCFFSAQAQMLLSAIQNSLNLTSPYLTKRCLKYYLGREQSFDKGKFQPSVAYKSVYIRRS